MQAKTPVLELDRAQTRHMQEESDRRVLLGPLGTLYTEELRLKRAEVTRWGSITCIHAV